MYYPRLTSWLIGLCLLGAVTSSANAQNFNQSDISGSNINTTTNLVPTVDSGSQTSSANAQTVSTATNFVQSLSETTEACTRSQDAATNPEQSLQSSKLSMLVASTSSLKLSQNSDAPNAPLSPECERLISLFNEANDFLTNLEAGEPASLPPTW